MKFDHHVVMKVGAVPSLIPRVAIALRATAAAMRHLRIDNARCKLARAATVGAVTGGF